MYIAVAWLRLDMRRRWRSLAVLALLIAIAVGCVATAVAGARRGQTAFDRLWARTLPATSIVLPNQPGFDWSKVRALPEVSALTLFVVYYGASIEGLPGASIAFPYADAAGGHTIERPVVLAGRQADPNRAYEANVTAHFAAAYGKGVGDTLTLQLSSPAQADAGFDASTGTPAGPRVTVRIVGIIRSVFWLDHPGDSGGLQPSNALVAKYRADIVGKTGQESFLNAMVRLRGGEAEIPAFRADLVRASGRSDIDVWDQYATVQTVSKVAGYESLWLLLFGAAALLAALFLIGQSLARQVTGVTGELRLLQAVGLIRREGVAATAAGPVLAALCGATLGVAAAYVASGWMPIGVAALAEPNPGRTADWLVFGAAWALAVLLTGAGAAAAAWSGLAAARQPAVPRSVIARGAARAGLPVPLVVGTRFALEPGHGTAGVPVRSALAGVLAGVLGVLAAFTFSAGVSDAAANPARFGQTWQLGTYFGENGQDFVPAARVLAAVAADKDVTGVNDAYVAGAQAGQLSVESFTYTPVAGKAVPAVLTSGRMPATAGEIALGYTTAGQLHASLGSVIRLAGGMTPRSLTVTGIGFVPEGSHNDYNEGAWLTSAGFTRLFAGAHFAFKYHLTEVSLRPGADPAAVAARLNPAVARSIGVQGLQFSPPDPLDAVQIVRDVAVLPLALGGFLSLLAAAAAAHALALAVRRRRFELAMLRVLGLTRGQARMVVATHGSVLAVFGLVLGIPLGLLVGQAVWRVVANFTPLAYQPPLAVWALALIGPVTIAVIQLLAFWPARRAARLPVAATLRAE